MRVSHNAGWVVGTGSWRCPKAGDALTEPYRMFRIGGLMVKEKSDSHVRCTQIGTHEKEEEQYSFFLSLLFSSLRG